MGKLSIMKRAFVMTADRHLVSEMVAKDTPSVIHIGDRISVTRPLDLLPHALVDTGEQGTIDFVDASTGWCEVLMDTVHRGLHDWFNHIWLEPFGTEDILDGIVLL
jgi:hypothetical protein